MKEYTTLTVRLKFETPSELERVSKYLKKTKCGVVLGMRNDATHMRAEKRHQKILRHLNNAKTQQTIRSIFGNLRGCGICYKTIQRDVSFLRLQDLLIIRHQFIKGNSTLVNITKHGVNNIQVN